MKEFFKDLKVIELASVLAGPSVGMFFSELGAEVIKIENKLSNGDITRSWKLATEDPNHPYSAYYSSVNFGKKSIFLNLKDHDDLGKAYKLIREAHIVIANFKAGDAQKMKLDYESLKVINPNIIYGEISGFGNSKRVAYDIVLQAESGFLSMNGTQAGELCKMPVALIDLLAAHQLKEGLLLAILQQQRKLQAIKVSVSLLDAAVSSLANQATNYLMANHIAQPLGTNHPNIAPYGELFKCKDDKLITLAIASNKQFISMARILNIPSLIEDKRFTTNQKRVQHRKELELILAKNIKDYNREDILEKLINDNIPAGAVRNINEVFDRKEVKARILSEKKEGKQLVSVEGNAFMIEY